MRSNRTCTDHLGRAQIPLSKQYPDGHKAAVVSLQKHQQPTYTATRHGADSQGQRCLSSPRSAPTASEDLSTKSHQFSATLAESTKVERGLDIEGFQVY